VGQGCEGGLSDPIVRRLRDYENEVGPVTMRLLRDDAAREIVSLRFLLALSFVVLGLAFLLLYTTGGLLCK